MARQPLGELPLASFVVPDAFNREKDSPASFNKRGTSPSALLSPPKRRILAAEGLASPSKSPAKRLFFHSMSPTDSSRSSSIASQLSLASTLESNASSPRSLLSASSSSTFVSHSMPHSPSKLSITITKAPSTPPLTRSRTRSLAPSPELTDSPMDISHPSEEGLLARPMSLKRLRSEGSSSSTSPQKSPTPKRRTLARGTSPALLPGLAEEAGDAEDEPEDKENVPPPRKKRAQFKSPPPVSKPTRDASLTPRSTRPRDALIGHSTPDKLRARRAMMEAEADMPDGEMF